MRRPLIFVFILIMMLSGCGTRTAATLSPAQSATDTAATVAPGQSATATTATVSASQSASASVPALQFSVKGIKDGVDPFLLVSHYKSAYDGDECFNITPEQLKQSGYSVFKYNMSCASFLLYSGGVYPLGEWLGGFGVVSMAVCDLDKDRKPEFYFTFSWGSGRHRSQAGYFDPNTKKVTVFDYSYLDKDMLITGDASGLKLYGTDFAPSPGFTDYTINAGDYIAQIDYEGGAVKLEPANGALVPDQQSEASPSPSQSLFSKTELYKYSGGKLIKDSVITDEKGIETVKNAVFNYLIKDSAYPSVDINKLTDYIKIKCDLGEYYAFEKDGKYCMQSAERYSYIKDDLYALLYKLASGT